MVDGHLSRPLPSVAPAGRTGGADGQCAARPLGRQLNFGRLLGSAYSRDGPLFLERVLQAADGVLDLPLDLVGLAIGGHLGVTGGFADSFLDGALGLFGGADDAILIHVTNPPFEIMPGESIRPAVLPR